MGSARVARWRVIEMGGMGPAAFEASAVDRNLWPTSKQVAMQQAACRSATPAAAAQAPARSRSAARAAFRPSHQAPRSGAAPRAAAPAQLRVAAQSGMERVVTAAAGSNGAPAASSNRLLIVGPGVLGSYLGKLWVDENGAGSVVGQTNSTTNHAK